MIFRAARCVAAVNKIPARTILIQRRTLIPTNRFLVKDAHLKVDWSDGADPKWKDNSPKEGDGMVWKEEDFLGIKRPNINKDSEAWISLDNVEITSQELEAFKEKDTTPEALGRSISAEQKDVSAALKWLNEWRLTVQADTEWSHYNVHLPDGKTVDYGDWMKQQKEESKGRAHQQLRQEPKLDQLGRSTGRGNRKRAKANVKLMPGSGLITVNGQHYAQYFCQPTERLNVSLPLLVTDTFRRFDAECQVKGGGKSGQSQACRLALARALDKFNPHFRHFLEPYQFLTEDPRIKEAKKPGKKKARKSHRWNRR